jgi:hypothetical protein
VTESDEPPVDRTEIVTSGSRDGGQQCPVCDTRRVANARFCESCGYELSASGNGWIAVVIADRDYYDRLAPEGLPFPEHRPMRVFPLVGAQIRIGRHSTSRNIHPEIDLSGDPEDPAISHLHALLVRSSDGSYSVIDTGSANGTTVNEDAAPIDQPTPLAAGDRVHLGAWTTVVIRTAG